MSQSELGPEKQDVALAVPGLYVPDEDTKKIFAAFKAEAEKRQLSSSENFDKSILTYSSGGLAVSLAFLKDFVPLSKASWTFLLYGSWLLFVTATGLTIISFLVSYKAQEQAVTFAEKYYMDGDESYLNKQTKLHYYIRWSNRISGGAFVLALIFTTFFVGLNLGVKSEMAENKKPGGITYDGVSTPSMQRVPNGTTTVERGLPTPSMQKIPAPQQSVPVPANTTGGSKSQ